MYTTINRFISLTDEERAKIKELTIYTDKHDQFWNADEDKISAFAKALKSCEQLESLDISGCCLNKLSASLLTILFEALPFCPRLNLLDLTSNHLAGNLEILAASLQRCKKLKTLYLGSNLHPFSVNRVFSMESAAPLIKVISACPQLEKLSLDDNDFSRYCADEIRDIIQVLRTLRELKSLNLSDISFEDLGEGRFKMILNYIVESQQLKIWLGKNDLTFLSKHDDFGQLAFQESSSSNKLLIFSTMKSPAKEQNAKPVVTAQADNQLPKKCSLKQKNAH